MSCRNRSRSGTRSKCGSTARFQIRFARASDRTLTALRCGVGYGPVVAACTLRLNINTSLSLRAHQKRSYHSPTVHYYDTYLRHSTSKMKLVSIAAALALLAPAVLAIDKPLDIKVERSSECTRKSRSGKSHLQCLIQSSARASSLRWYLDLPETLLTNFHLSRRQSRGALSRHTGERRHRVRRLVQARPAAFLPRRQGPGDQGLGSGTAGYVSWR